LKVEREICKAENMKEIGTMLLLLSICFLLYKILLEKNIDRFVPYNSFEVPRDVSDEKWQELNDKFGRLIQVVNSTIFSVAYSLEDMGTAFMEIINHTGIGKFTMLSMGKPEVFTLHDVVIQDIGTLAVTKFTRVDFMVESLNPFKIEKVIITPEKDFVSSQHVRPTSELKPDGLFRIKNSLHLFNPYNTSHREMELTPADRGLFQDALKEKDILLKSYTVESQNAPGNPSTDAVIAVSSPVPAQLSPQIVGAGPLHPVGL
jgi:hypothetical protein